LVAPGARPDEEGADRKTLIRDLLAGESSAHRRLQYRWNRKHPAMSRLMEAFA
jgi:hypothetical protein